MAYDCIIAHNLTDLLDCKHLTAPRVLVVHSAYEGRLAAEGGEVPLDELRGTIRRYLKLMGGHAIAISKLKTGPDGFPSDIVTNGVELDDYQTHSGEIAAGLRVVNQIVLKRAYLRWDLHEAAFGGLPIKIVGHNPDLAEVEPARDWDHLKALLASHRFFVHTADPRYEDKEAVAGGALDLRGPASGRGWRGAAR